MSKQWLPVMGYEDSYEVSDEGEVRSLDRLIPAKLGSTRKAKGSVLKPSLLSNGRLQVRLYKHGKSVWHRVHRLVAEAFIPNPEELPFVLHWDDNPKNNAASNLRWGTRSDNVMDMVRLGTHHLSSRTHCKNGHEYTPENTGPGARGSRRCRECSRNNKRRHDANKKSRGE